jgi:hypothetical protein
MKWVSAVGSAVGTADESAVGFAAESAVGKPWSVSTIHDCEICKTIRFTGISRFVIIITLIVFQTARNVRLDEL